MKKFFQIFFLIICALLILKKDKIKRYFAEQCYFSHLMDHNIIKHCYSPEQDLLKIFTQEGFDYYKYDQQITKNSLEKIKNINTKVQKESKIPMILHKIHLTDQNSNNKLEPFYLEELKLNFNSLNSSNSSWNFIIWTNKPELFADLASIKNLEILNIDDFESHPYYKILNDVISLGQKDKTYYAKASNILKLMALQKFGGIYSDNDYEIYKPTQLIPFLNEFDFIGARESIKKESYYSANFIAAKANHPIIKDALAKSKRNYYLEMKNPNIPEYLKYPCNLEDKMIMSSAALLTISYFGKNNLDGNFDIILPSWMMMNTEFARLKNNDCKLSEITPELFNKTTQALPSLLESFNNNPKLQDWQYTCNKDNPALQNIYYNMKYHKNYDIIGADPSCASWTPDMDYKKYLYFNYPWEWKIFAESASTTTNQTCQ